MNSDKIILEIKCVGIDKSFDCIVPRKITGKSLCGNVFAIISDNLGISFGDYNNAMVISERSECPISLDATLNESGIDSGDTLYII